MHSGCNDNFFRSEKLTKTLPDPLIFTIGKILSINQQLSKIQSKFDINKDYYLTNQNKLIYEENKVRKKAL